jgi:repressor LexA
MAMEEMTSKQKAVLEYVEARARQTGFRPSLEEVRRYFGFSSLNSVVMHIRALEHKGFLPQPDLIKGTPATPAIMIPVLGTVAAGSPMLADEHIDKWIFVTPPTPETADYFGLRVQGDSMIDDHIMQDDIVVVHKQETAEHNDVVVALFGDEATVKRLHKGPEGCALWPANPAYQPIPMTADVIIVGRVVGLIRERQS